MSQAVMHSPALAARSCGGPLGAPQAPKGRPEAIQATGPATTAVTAGHAQKPGKIRRKRCHR